MVVVTPIRPIRGLTPAPASASTQGNTRCWFRVPSSELITGAQGLGFQTHMTPLSVG